jgi:hypothetical protein
VPGAGVPGAGVPGAGAQHLLRPRTAEGLCPQIRSPDPFTQIRSLLHKTSQLPRNRTPTRTRTRTPTRTRDVRHASSTSTAKAEDEYEKTESRPIELCRCQLRQAAGFHPAVIDLSPDHASCCGSEDAPEILSGVPHLDQATGEGPPNGIRRHPDVLHLLLLLQVDGQVPLA